MVSMILSNNIFRTQGYYQLKFGMQIESGFPTDLVKAKIINSRGKVVNKLTYGAVRENFTTLDVSSAVVRMLDPLIILSGVKFQSNLRNKNR